MKGGEYFSLETVFGTRKTTALQSPGYLRLAIPFNVFIEESSPAAVSVLRTEALIIRNSGRRRAQSCRPPHLLRRSAGKPTTARTVDALSWFAGVVRRAKLFYLRDLR